MPYSTFIAHLLYQCINFQSTQSVAAHWSLVTELCEKSYFLFIFAEFNYKAIEASDIMHCQINQYFDETSEYIESALASGGKLMF